MEEKRFKVAFIRTLEQCMRLDKEPYKCSDDMEKYGELFNKDFRYYLFELDLPLTYFNKRLEKYGLRKEWRENLLKLDEMYQGRYKERLKEKIFEHNKKMEELEKKKRQQKKEELAKLQSHYGKETERKENKKNFLFSELGKLNITKHPYRNQYFRCDHCMTDSNETYVKILKKSVCRDCIMEFLKIPEMSWYHNHTRFKPEELREDLKRAMKDEEKAKIVRSIVSARKAKENAFDRVVYEKAEYAEYPRENDYCAYLQLKGVMFDNRDKVLDLIRAYQEEYKDFPKIYFKKEPDNPHDENAVAVYVKLPGLDMMAGYVPKMVSERVFVMLTGGFNLKPYISCFYTKEYSYRFFDEDSEDWEWEESSHETLCINIFMEREAIDFADDVIGLPF